MPERRVPHFNQAWPIHEPPILVDEHGGVELAQHVIGQAAGATRSRDQQGEFVLRHRIALFILALSGIASRYYPSIRGFLLSLAFN